VLLHDLAHARSGDKGATSDITIVAFHAAAYDVLRRELSAYRVREYFSDLPISGVDRYELPQLHALKFVLHGALGGGVTMSLRSDTQGKTLGLSLLRMWVDLPDDTVLSRRSFDAAR
jgi:hypothetical protein